MVNTDSRPTSVYRYYDKADMLIYVGITNQGIGRNRQHNASKEWWPFVARQDVEHLPDRASALALEKALIQRYRPPFNTQHNPVAASLRAAYLAYANGFGDDPIETDARAISARLHQRLPLLRAGTVGEWAVFRTMPEHSPVTDALDVTSWAKLSCDGGYTIQRVDRGPRVVLFSVPRQTYEGQAAGILNIKTVPTKRQPAFAPRSIVIKSSAFTPGSATVEGIITTLQGAGKHRNRGRKKSAQRRILEAHYAITPPVGPFIGEQLDLLSETG